MIGKLTGVFLLIALIAGIAFIFLNPVPGAIARPTGLFSKTGVVFPNEDFSSIEPSLTLGTYVKVYEQRGCGPGYTGCWHNAISIRYWVKPDYSTGCGVVSYGDRRLDYAGEILINSDKWAPNNWNYVTAQACPSNADPTGWDFMVDNDRVCETSFSDPELLGAILCKLNFTPTPGPVTPPVVGGTPTPEPPEFFPVSEPSPPSSGNPVIDFFAGIGAFVMSLLAPLLKLFGGG